MAIDIKQKPSTPSVSTGEGNRTAKDGLRVAVHTHITGLGLDENGEAIESADGLVGQRNAREAAGLVVDMIKAKKLSGKASLLVGPPGGGKTAIAVAMSRELGTRVPFCAMTASEVYSREVKPTEVLTEVFRKAMGLRIREVKEVYEGEVVDLSVEETENPHGNYGKAVSAVLMTLRSVKGTKSLKLAPIIHTHLEKQKVRVGDVIYVESQTAVVKRLGRCDAHRGEADLETEEYVPLPRGEVFRHKEAVQDVSLHELDVANCRPQGSNDLMGVLNQYLTPKKTEITERLRNEVDKIANKFITEGIAELTPGVVFIDEAHALTLECFAFLARLIESPFSPALILATNRGLAKVNNAPDITSPHGIPFDFLDRLLIIKTEPYTLEQTLKIIAIRANCESVRLEPDALAKLGDVAAATSLRYALQLLAPAATLAKAGSRSVIALVDVTEADGLFLDARSSALRFLK